MKLVKFNEKDFIDEPFEMLALLNIEFGEEERWVVGKIGRVCKGGHIYVDCYDYNRDVYFNIHNAYLQEDIKFYASLD